MTALTVYAIDGVTPVVDPSAYVHPSAVLIGDVIVAAGCYIGPCACLRGDFGRIDVRAPAPPPVQPVAARRPAEPLPSVALGRYLDERGRRR